MKSTRKLTCRLRIPVPTRHSRRLRGGRRFKRGKLRGGFLPALVPIIAAAVSAIPGIASVALQASQKH
ncbi:pX [Bovine adenovirus 10]|uniref:PX n=1 Tax=Bovine adenovirus C serotype 10 TaxID=39788 RepID=A0A9X9KQH1_ADEBA|nr:pX [Bovine adenovirus 10]